MLSGGTPSKHIHIHTRQCYIHHEFKISTKCVAVEAAHLGVLSLRGGAWGGFLTVFRLQWGVNNYLMRVLCGLLHLCIISGGSTATDKACFIFKQRKRKRKGFLCEFTTLLTVSVVMLSSPVRLDSNHEHGN